MSRPLAFAILTVAIFAAVISTPAYMHGIRFPEINSPPVAVDDSYTVHGGGDLGPYMMNDSDPDGDPISFDSIVTFPSHGSLTGLQQGDRHLYRPSSGYLGADSFTYKICDSQAACSIATVYLNVFNNPPVAVNDNYQAHGGTNIGPYMSNDYDPDGDTFTDTILTYPTHGTLYGLAAGYPFSHMYAPQGGYTGSDSFTYKVCDQLNLCSAPATVTISVNNTAPTPKADFYTVYGNGIIGPFVENDSDPELDIISFNTIVTYPAHGSLYGLSNPTPGDYMGQYVAQTGFSGTDSFDYKICDTWGLCGTATVYVLVIPGAGPSGKPPYSCCPTDPAVQSPLNPSAGGLPQASGGAAGEAGPSAGDPVDLSNGRELYTPEPDLSIYNASGPGVVWQRNYSGNQALTAGAGYGSPGLSRGWVHSYDLSIQGVSGSWDALKLLYPNGASETLTPQLSGGQPTGAFTTVAGAPYVATGVSGTSTGTWQSVTIIWKDQTAWKFTFLSGTTYALSQLTNRTGQSLDFSWNSSRALTQVNDNSTSTVLLTLAYSANGRLATATDTYGHQRSYTFSAGSSTSPITLQSVSQIVTSGTPNPPARWTYSYTSDRGQQLNTITVPSPTGSGNSTATINYDSAGKVTSLVDANGNQRVYTYNSSSTQVQVKDSANNIASSWTQKFNSSGMDTGITDAANHSTTIAYADSANPYKRTSVTDRNTHATTYTYDQFGNVATVTNPRSVTTTYTWTYTAFSAGRLTSVQEGTKPATTISYFEPSGLVQSITRPAPNGSGTTTTSFTYDSLGNVLTVTGPGNNAATQITTTLNYTTDVAYSQSAKIAQPITITDNLGHTIHLRYDSQARLTSVTDALGNETNVSYNLSGQPDTVTFPATGQTGTGRGRRVNSYLYTGGPITSVASFDESNAQVRQVTSTYGPEGESLSVSGSTEPVTNTYDALYRFKTLKDGNNNSTTYAYNNIGLVSLITMPGGETTQFPSYDNDGNLLQRIDGNVVVTNYLYTDAESLLTDIQYPASTTLNVHFAYDTFGRRTSMTDGTGSQSYSYGNLDELLSASTTYTGLSAKTIAYSYYANGGRQTMTTPAGTFSYNYDAAGRPSTVTNPFSETTSWAYLNNDWLQTQTLANGATATYSHNALGQVTRVLNQIGGSTISDFSSINYDGAGNRNSVTASIPGATSLNGTTGYTYDAKDQLTQENSTRNGSVTDSFGYDSTGNPTSFKGVTKTYNANNQQTGTGFVHDSNGNPTTYGGNSLIFDSENRMTAYGTLLTAGYTGGGLRAWKQNASGRTYFLYDGTLPVAEMDSTGSVTATNSYGTGSLLSRREGSSSAFYSFDSEGNVAQRSDASGSVLANHLYSAHGSELSGSFNDPFGYKAQFGYYTDNDTGLQLLTNRYYDPSAGRFLTRDPISYAGGVNLYSYTANNPMNFMDPFGLDVLVIEQGRSGNNPFGHTAIAITGRGVFSFGNGREMATDNKGNIIGGNVADYLSRESRGRDTYIFIIKTTPLQDAAIAAALRFIAENEPALPTDKSIALDNCSIRSNRGLDAGNIPNSSGWPAHHLPGSAGTRAMRGGSSPQHIPQGAGWLPTSVEPFMPKP